KREKLRKRKSFGLFSKYKMRGEKASINLDHEKSEEVKNIRRKTIWLQHSCRWIPLGNIIDQSAFVLSRKIFSGYYCERLRGNDGIWTEILNDLSEGFRFRI